MTINKKQILIPLELNGLRIDSAVHKLLPEYSRGKIQSWIKAGHITVEGKTISSKKKIIGGENLIIEIQEEEELKQFRPENIDIDIIYEDKDIFIVNKKPGMVVHPAAGNWSGTLLNAILYHYPENEVLSRAGIVHRLDKDTSGLMVVARNEKAQLNLIKQLQNKAVKREYPGIDPETGKYALEVNEGEKFTGDSVEYNSLADAVKRLKNPIGASMEIGVRLGLGSKTIIDAYRHHHPNTSLVHLGVDPYGNIDYAASDSVLARKFNYDNLMRKTTLINFAEDYPEFHLVNFEDTEFMKRFADGYPVYDEYKRMVDKYEMIHFDGPHDTLSVMKEAVFFNQRKADQTVWVFDDISGLQWATLENFMTKAKFKLVHKGMNKAMFEYIK